MNVHDLTGDEIYARESKPAQMSIFKMASITFFMFVVLFSIAGMVEV